MFDAIQFFRDHHIQHWTSGKNVTPGWVNTRCPFCDDTSNHLGWNSHKKYVNCWKCGVHSLIDSVRILLRVQREKAQDIIAEYAGSSSLDVVEKKAIATSITLPGSDLTIHHKKYLEKRKFNPEHIISKYKVLGTGPMERWEKIDYSLRIIIPIIFDNTVISFQGRDITEKQELRYKGCPIEKSVINYKHVLYNWDNVKFKKCVVVEGLFDAWRMGDGFVASFGTSMTTSQLSLLTEMDEIFFLFDNELEAQERATRYARELSAIGKLVHVLNVDIGKDPGEYTDEEARQIRQELNIF